MYFKITILSFFFFIILTTGYSQDIKPCSTDEIYHELLENNPDDRQAILEAKQELENLSLQYQKSGISNKSGASYIIPVVFHVLHQNGAENISDEQIHDAVRVVNEDFRKQNMDTSNIVNQFKSIAADTKIEIRLAKRDPFGNCTNGIDRIYTTHTNEVATNSSKLNPWPREKYLNIWVVSTISSGAAGYAYYPHSTISNPAIDGIVVLSHYVGSIGTSNTYRSRTLTHEIGHYLNLAHTWGSSNSPGSISNCNLDDGVFDTPLTRGHTSCNLSAVTCDTSLDNVQNYMEYAYCSNMFTTGQAARMHAALSSNIAGRNNLYSPQNLIATGVFEPGIVCEADFEVSRRLACINDTIVFFDKSYHNPQNWQWNLPGASPQIYTDSIVYATYPSEGVYGVLLTVSDSSNSATKMELDYITILDTIADYTTGYSEDFESASLPNEWLYIENGSGNSFEKANVGYLSSRSLYVNNFGLNGAVQEFELISPGFKLSTLQNPKLIFQYSFAAKNIIDSDKLEIYTSSDCGETWNLHFILMGSLLATTSNLVSQNFVPNNNQWRRYSVPFNSSASNSDNVLVKFKYTTGGGNNFYLDDIQIDGMIVGIEEKRVSGDINLYPNPANSDAILEFELEKNENVNVEIFNIQGKKINEQYLGQMDAGKHQLKLNIRDIPKGVFFVKVHISNKYFFSKLVKQ